MDKYGSQCGQEKVSRLLGIELSSMSFDLEDDKPKESYMVQM